MVIVIEIEDRCVTKPFLGGWRNIVTGTEYHDALTQTCPRDNVVYRGSCRTKRKDEDHEASGSCFIRPGSNVMTRDRCVGTDTSMLTVVLATYRSKYTSVVDERATQTSRLPDLRDKLLTPLATEPTTNISNNNGDPDSPGFFILSRADGCREKRINENEKIHYVRLKEVSAIKIQKCYRAYRLRMNIGALARLSRETRALTPPELEKIHHFRHCRSSQFEIINPLPPKKPSDFEMLQNVLERWRFYENSRLERGFFGTSKLAARIAILHREIELLRSIETIKARVRDERKHRRLLENLEKLAESEVWRVDDGKTEIFVDTIRVQRARECRDFYRSLINEKVSCSVRMEILKKLRKYIAEHTCNYAKDLASLVDQEIELLPLNYNKKIMNSLRNRLTLALLRLTMNFCSPKQKLQNNQAIAIPRGKTIKKATFPSKLCKRCGQFLTIDDLSASVITQNSDLLPTCENCRKIQPCQSAKIVYEPYEMMLRDLRNREINYSSSSAIGESPAWIVDTKIIYRLVNYVWHGKSGISECDDLYRLTLVRFRPDVVWSPWNNLVLTRSEAALHQSTVEPWKMYASTIMKKFIVKNLQAKLRFDFKTSTNFY